MTFASMRETIRATRNTIYMNTGFTGPSTDRVVNRVHSVLEKEAEVGPASVEGLQYTRGLGGEATEAVAQLLNASPEQITLTHGTTEGVHVVVYGMKWQPGDEFITCNLEHPALATPATVLEERFGAVSKRVEIATDSSAGEIIERVVSAITPQTKLVALSHVQFSCGLMLPIKPIIDGAHRQNVPVLIDGAQTGGQLAIDVKALDVDYYSISGQKWLLGPQGTGAMYVKSERWQGLDPLFTTHSIVESRAMPGDGPGGAPRPLQRFRIASQSPALTAGFTEAVRVVLELGQAEIEARSKALADRFKAGAAGIKNVGLTCPTDPQLSCGLASITIEGWQPQQIVDALWERWRIAVRSVAFPPAVRFSLGWFNTEDEVDKALSALQTLASENPPPPTDQAAH
jgi:L-cysteine/cystine lyase